MICKKWHDLAKFPKTLSRAELKTSNYLYSLFNIYSPRKKWCIDHRGCGRRLWRRLRHSREDDHARQGAGSRRRNSRPRVRRVVRERRGVRRLELERRNEKALPSFLGCSPNGEEQEKNGRAIQRGVKAKDPHAYPKCKQFTIVQIIEKKRQC